MAAEQSLDAAAPPLIARIVVIPTAGNAGPLDYRVGVHLQAVVRPGLRVIVPLGRRRAIGIVIELAGASSYPRLKEIVGAVDAQPLLDDQLMQLCRWMADYYLCSVGEAFSAALPGSVRVSVERVAHVLALPTADDMDKHSNALRKGPEKHGASSGRADTTFDLPASTVRPEEPPSFGRRLEGRAVDEWIILAAKAALPPLEDRLLEWLAAHGPQSTRAITNQFGAPARRALVTLQRTGRLRIEEQVRGGDGPTKYQKYYRATRDLDANEATEWRRKRPARFALYAYLHAHPLRRARAVELQATFPNFAAKLRPLIKAGLVAVDDEEVYRPVLPDAVPADRPVALTTEQNDAITVVQRSIGVEFAAFVLWGVTGSGKTEVYLRCIASCLAAGRTALVLVPEISLTHQLVDRVRARFGDHVAVLHSGLSDGERWDEWRKIARGEVPIVVGARSAVFAPLPRLGLVVVDEEHDAAFKQDDGIRYNGRDLAVVRAKLAACPVVLGSATPAMETFHNGKSGRYRMLVLSERVEARPLPAVDVVDLRRTSQGGRSVLIAPRLAATLKANIAAHGQSLVFLNRRGFANFLQCHACGEALGCPNCSVTLTLHRRWQALRCHHCDYTIPIPAACPACGGLSLGGWGAGTEQVEAVLKRLLPGARIGRMDRDTTSRKGTLRALLAAWENREYDVLVGTQMITKGHDVPGVTLVGVLLADLSLNLPDFRASERTFQLLTQVAGRAGRGSRPGRVLIQTLQPTHFSLQCAAHHDYRAFAEHELAARRELGYPPFARLVQIRCEGERPDATERVVRDLAAHLRHAAVPGVSVLGPAPAPIERLRRRHRWQLLIRGRHGAAVRRVARDAREAARRTARAADVRLIVDVDPYSML